MNIYEISIDEKTMIKDYIKNEIDETLDNQVLRFEIIYNSDIYNEIKPILSEKLEEDYIVIDYTFKNNNFNLNNKYIKMFIDDLKNNKIYNYAKLNKVDIKVYTNSKTLKMIH